MPRRKVAEHFDIEAAEDPVASGTDVSDDDDDDDEADVVDEIEEIARENRASRARPARAPRGPFLVDSDSDDGSALHRSDATAHRVLDSFFRAAERPGILDVPRDLPLRPLPYDRQQGDQVPIDRVIGWFVTAQQALRKLIDAFKTGIYLPPPPFPTQPRGEYRLSGLGSRLLMYQMRKLQSISRMLSEVQGRLDELTARDSS